MKPSHTGPVLALILGFAAAYALSIFARGSWWIWPIVLLGLPYAIGPVAVRFAQKQPGDPQLSPKRPEELPGEIARYLSDMAGALAADGFVQWPTFSFGIGSVSIYLKILINRAAGDMVMAAAVQTPMGVREKHLAFATRLSDGTEIETMNRQTPGVLPAFPDKDLLQLPRETDPRRLYQIHRERVRRLAMGRAAKLPADGEEIATANAEILKDLKRQETIGFMYYDSAAAVYRPTWKGAVLMTWKMCWPVKQIRRGRMNRRANEALRQLGFAG